LSRGVSPYALLFHHYERSVVISRVYSLSFMRLLRTIVLVLTLKVSIPYIYRRDNDESFILKKFIDKKNFLYQRYFNFRKNSALMLLDSKAVGSLRWGLPFLRFARNGGKFQGGLPKADCLLKADFLLTFF